MLPKRLSELLWTKGGPSTAACLHISAIYNSLIWRGPQCLSFMSEHFQTHKLSREEPSKRSRSNLILVPSSLVLLGLDTLEYPFGFLPSLMLSSSPFIISPTSHLYPFLVPGLALEGSVLILRLGFWILPLVLALQRSMLVTVAPR